MVKAPNQFFCRNPFTRLEINRGGDCYVCCSHWLPKSIGNLNETTLDEVWNSPAAQEIRASILDGSYRYCDLKKCGDFQTGSGSVAAVGDIAEFDIQEIIFDRSVVMERGPTDIALSQDATCNLSCPTCRKEIAVLAPNEKTELAGNLPKVLDQLKLVERVKITGGGDPFASPYYSKLLESITTEEYPRLKIYLHTNALLFTPNRWERISGIRRSIYKVEISIDAATAETYRINRRGGKFSQLEENLAFIAGLRRGNHFGDLIMSFVVQKNNWREMSQFVELGRKYGADKVLFAKLIDWGTFSPEDFRDRSIHDENHPEHSLFRDELRREIYRDPIVYLSNLSHLIN